MRKIYRVSSDPSSSRFLSISQGEPYFSDLSLFEGESKTALSPETSFLGEIKDTFNWNDFCFISPGAIAIPEAAWEECEEMYYLLASGGNELLSVKASNEAFRVINPLGFYPEIHQMLDTNEPSKLFSVLFRMKGFQKSDIFCMSAPELSGDDFKRTYEDFGFTGLLFEPLSLVD